MEDCGRFGKMAGCTGDVCHFARGAGEPISPAIAMDAGAKCNGTGFGQWSPFVSEAELIRNVKNREVRLALGRIAAPHNARSGDLGTAVLKVSQVRRRVRHAMRSR